MKNSGSKFTGLSGSGRRLNPAADFPGEAQSFIESFKAKIQTLSGSGALKLYLNQDPPTKTASVYNEIKSIMSLSGGSLYNLGYLSTMSFTLNSWIRQLAADPKLKMGGVFGIGAKEIRSPLIDALEDLKNKYDEDNVSEAITTYQNDIETKKRESVSPTRRRSLSASRRSTTEADLEAKMNELVDRRMKQHKEREARLGEENRRLTMTVEAFQKTLDALGKDDPSMKKKVAKARRQTFAAMKIEDTFAFETEEVETPVKPPRIGGSHGGLTPVKPKSSPAWDAMLNVQCIKQARESADFFAALGDGKIDIATLTNARDPFYPTENESAAKDYQKIIKSFPMSPYRRWVIANLMDMIGVVKDVDPDGVYNTSSSTYQIVETCTTMIRHLCLDSLLEQGQFLGIQETVLSQMAAHDVLKPFLAHREWGRPTIDIFSEYADKIDHDYWRRFTKEGLIPAVLPSAFDSPIMKLGEKHKAHASKIFGQLTTIMHQLFGSRTSGAPHWLPADRPFMLALQNLGKSPAATSSPATMFSASSSHEGRSTSPAAPSATGVHPADSTSGLTPSATTSASDS